MIEHATLTYLVNALWIAPLIAAATALCTHVGRLGPRTRHGAWMAALVLAVGLPGAPAALLPVRLAPAPVAQATVPSTTPFAVATVSAPPAGPPPLLALDRTWTRAILGVAGIAVAIALFRLLVAVLAGRRLVRQARPCELDPDVRRVLTRARGPAASPPILVSGSIASPVVVGAARPAILVPPGFATLPWDEQRAALLHEMAHVTRRDYGWNLICEAVSLPLAWHPAVLPIKAGLRRSREAACDAVAARAMASRVTYAKCLVSLANRLGPAQPTSAAVVGLFGKSDLEERLVTLLNPAPGRTSAVLRMAGASALALAVLAPALFLRVTPACADQPVIARHILVQPGDAPAVARAAPAPAKAPVRPASARTAHMASRDAVTPVRPFAARPTPPLAEPALPAPPALPALPALPSAPVRPDGATYGRYDAVVRRAVEEALSAEKAAASDQMRRAMAELRVHEEEMLRADQARIHAEVTAAMAELDRARVEQTLDRVKSRLRSPEIREAMEAAARRADKAAKAAAEAQAEAEADAVDSKD